MKKQMLAVAMFLSSTTVFACPDLSGTWSCKDTDGKESNITVTQEAATGGVLYHIKDNGSGKTEDVLADGNSHSFVKGDYTGTMTAMCDASGTKVTSHVDFANTGIALTGGADIIVDLQNANTMVTTTDAKFTVGGGSQQTMHSVETCTK